MRSSSYRRMVTFDQPLLCIGQATIRPSRACLTFGVRANTSIKYPINAIVRSFDYSIRQRRKIRSSLTPSALLVALVLPRIDHCNASAPACQLRRLRLLIKINIVARAVSRRSRCDRITAFIRDDLHWLLNTQPVHFKVSVRMFFRTSTDFHLTISPTSLFDLLSALRPSINRNTSIYSTSSKTV